MCGVMSEMEMITEQTIDDSELRQQTSNDSDEDDAGQDDDERDEGDANAAETSPGDTETAAQNTAETGMGEDVENDPGRADDNVSENGIEITAEKVKQRGSRRQPTGRQYNCTSCSRTFSARRDLVTHEYMHRENPTSFCSVCNKSFSSEAAYRRHAASHNRKTASSRRAKKTCSQCAMQFDTMRQLSSHHAATHVDEKRFICAICGSQFAWPENLRAHQRTHQLDPHECDICGRRFVDATSLRVHLRNSHGPTSSDPPAQRKQHCCKVCGRSFQFDFSLRAHMKGHAQSPVAASLHRLKQHYPESKLTAVTPQSAPPQTRYVHVDSKGVIDLDLGQSAGSEPQEIIVEVYNTAADDANIQQNSAVATLDFSDVLDQSQTTTQPDGDQGSVETEHMSSQDSVVVSNSETYMPVWYVRPTNTQQTEPAQTTTTPAITTAVTTTNTTSTLSPQAVWYVKPDSVQQTQTTTTIAATTTTTTTDNTATNKTTAVSAKPVWYVKPDDAVPQTAMSAQGTNTTTEDTTTTAAAAATTTLSSKLVWYVKPDDAPQTETSPQLRQQQSEVTEEGDGGENLNSEALSDDPATTTADATTTTTTPHTAAASSEVADTDVEPSTASYQDDDIDDDDDDVEDDEEDEPQQPGVSDIPATAPTVTVPSSQTGSTTANDYRDVLDWMMTDMEPPAPQRAAPFIYRHHPSQRNVSTRVREPFLFNCVMTDEKPFVCMTCGQCFRWDISLKIHHRVHTDGTFPNKSRGRPVTHSCPGKTSARRGKGPTPLSSSIVRHRRTSSSEEEEDDEFTFHVHADGPSEVSRNPPQRGKGRGRGQVRGRGRGAVARGRSVTVKLPSGRVVTVKQRQVTDAGVKKTGSGGSRGCNGVRVRQRQSGVSRKSRHRRAARRACHICLHCNRIVTRLSSFHRHLRRAHCNTQLSCQTCKAHFTSRVDLRRHCQQLHSTGVTKCRRCQRGFTDSRRLQRHMKLHRMSLCHKTFLSTMH